MDIHNYVLKQLYDKLVLILSKNNNKHQIIDDYLVYVNLESFDSFINDHSNDPTFFNSIYRYILNISRGLNLPTNMIFAVRINSECIKGSNYYADQILDFLSN